MKSQPQDKSRQADGSARGQGSQSKESSFPYKPHLNLDGDFKDLCLLQDASPDSLQADLGAPLQCSHINRIYLIRDFPYSSRITSVYAVDLGAQKRMWPGSGAQ